jgi:hypothetical protein
MLSTMHEYTQRRMQACMHACMHMHACIHTYTLHTYAYKNDASLSLRVPAQASRLQSADDAASGRVPGPHVAFVSVSGMLLHATWAHACVHV